MFESYSSEYKTGSMPGGKASTGQWCPQETQLARVDHEPRGLKRPESGQLSSTSTVRTQSSKGFKQLAQAKNMFFYSLLQSY